MRHIGVNHGEIQSLGRTGAFLSDNLIPNSATGKDLPRFLNYAHPNLCPADCGVVYSKLQRLLLTQFKLGGGKASLLFAEFKEGNNPKLQQSAVTTFVASPDSVERLHSAKLGRDTLCFLMAGADQALDCFGLGLAGQHEGELKLFSVIEIGLLEIIR